MSLRITAVQTGLVAATVCEFVHGGPARNARVSGLRRCDERTRVIKCVNNFFFFLRHEAKNVLNIVYNSAHDHNDESEKMGKVQKNVIKKITKGDKRNVKLV